MDHKQNPDSARAFADRVGQGSSEAKDSWALRQGQALKLARDRAVWVALDDVMHFVEDDERVPAEAEALILTDQIDVRLWKRDKHIICLLRVVP